MKFTMNPIPEDKKRGWKVLLNGQEQGGVETFCLVSEKHGELTYGLRPEGYDAWVYREPNGGGEVTIPYSISPEGQLIVGLLQEARPNMGVIKVWCAIGGFVDRGESKEKAQVREAGEEAGLDAKKARILPGLPTVANRAFWVADCCNGEGVHAFGLPIPYNQLDPEENVGSGVPVWKLRETNFLPGFKKQDDLRFFICYDAIAKTADGLARSAIAQLMSVLFRGAAVMFRPV